jgi:hypothetical protein
MPPTLDVFGWLADRSGCGHLRVELPLTALRAAGYTAGYGDRLPLQPGVDHIPGEFARTVVAQRTCNPGPTMLWQATARHADRPRMVFELDDDLWHVDGSSPVAHGFFSQPDVLARLEANIAVADVVTVTMPELADQVSRFNPNVHVVPNFLPAWLLQHERPRRDGTVTIGWGGSQTHAMDVAELGGQLRQVMDRNPHTELHLMGTNYAREMGIRDRVRVTPWMASVPDYWRAIDYDIMLAPLKPAIFNRSKSPLRPLEAAALGIPVIASDYGPYAQFVQHGVTGFLVKRDHEWGRYLRELVNDQAMRDEMGAAARRQAADWTIADNVDKWQKVLLP